MEKSKSVELTCDCCGHTETFSGLDAAFEAGWDAPPFFTGYVGCNLCPGAFIVMGIAEEKHGEVHERWKREGRPEEFSQETCVRAEDRLGAR